MQLLVFGASGRVGRRVCDTARGDGHDVTAFVRDAGRAPPDTVVVEGDVTDPVAVADAVAGHDAVCSALGPSRGGDPRVLVTGIDTIATAMTDHGIDRLVAVAAAGILQATPGRLRLDAPEFPDALRAIADAHRDVYERLRDSPLAWTLVCPPRMPDGEGTGQYRTEVDYLPEGGQSISTGDVAAFVCETAVEGGHERERVGIAY